MNMLRGIFIHEACGFNWCVRNDHDIPPSHLSASIYVATDLASLSPNLQFPVILMMEMPLKGIPLSFFSFFINKVNRWGVETEANRNFLEYLNK